MTDLVELIQTFSEERLLAIDNPFQSRPLYKIEAREANISWACEETTLGAGGGEKASKGRAVYSAS